MSTDADLAADIQYLPGPLVRLMGLARRHLGVRFGPRLVAWAMQNNGHVRLGPDGPWLPARPGLVLRRPAAR